MPLKLQRMAEAFYSVTVWFNTHDEGVRKYSLHNFSVKTFYALREEIFTAGLSIRDDNDPTCGHIVPPWMIKQVKWYKQEKFFPGLQNSELKKS